MPHKGWWQKLQGGRIWSVYALIVELHELVHKTLHHHFCQALSIMLGTCLADQWWRDLFRCRIDLLNLYGDSTPELTYCWMRWFTMLDKCLLPITWQSKQKALGGIGDVDYRVTVIKYSHHLYRWLWGFCWRSGVRFTQYNTTCDWWELAWGEDVSSWSLYSMQLYLHT